MFEQWVQRIDPGSAGALADALVVLHVGVVLFVLLGEVAFLIGGTRGWRWVRSFPLRLVHLLLMVFVAVQAWLGALCPLTEWEQALRRHAGAGSYHGGFIERVLSDWLYVDAPGWVFVAAYTAFAALVAATWLKYPPRRGGSGATTGAGD